MSFQNTNERQNRPHPMLGAQLGQYRILDVVGGGGMGVVFRARQEMVERDVALKLLPPELAHDEINSKRLEREAKALAKLNHPNIVTTFDFGLTPHGQAYLVMELVDGESLKEILLREGRLELSRALKMFIQMADAMRFAHQSGIVHRDLKPHNVMIAQSPSPDYVKILDFGIASLADSQKLTRVGEIIGSPLYMSPEQCLSEPVDNRTDIYALGVLMYVCLTGQVPFKGDTLYETVEKKCTQPVPRFAEIAPSLEVPGFLEELIRHCLAVEPKDRFQNMDEVKDLLESIPVRKAVPSDATIVFDKPSITREPALPAKTIKEKMRDSAESRKLDTSKSRPSSTNNARQASRPAAPAHSRYADEPKGIVLTPGMLMLGILGLLVFMIIVVVSAVAFITNGTLIPATQQQKMQQSTGTTSSAPASPEVKQTPQPKVPSTPPPETTVTTPQAKPLEVPATPENPAKLIDVPATAPVTTKKKPRIRTSTQRPDVVVKKTKKKTAPRTYSPPSDDLPAVRHGGHLTPKTPTDYWESYKKKKFD